MVEFAPPPDWQPPENDSLDEQGYFEGIARCKLKDGKICMYEFEGGKLDGKEEKAEGEESTDLPAPETQLRSMLSPQTPQPSY